MKTCILLCGQNRFNNADNSDKLSLTGRVDMSLPNGDYANVGNALSFSLLPSQFVAWNRVPSSGADLFSVF